MKKSLKKLMNTTHTFWRKVTLTESAARPVGKVSTISTQGT
jgi:hypothetical protein